MAINTKDEIKGILVTFFRDGRDGDYLVALNAAIEELNSLQVATLPNAPEIEAGCMQYLKEVGMVDKKHIIAHDWSSGANWVIEEVKKRNSAK